VGNGANERLPHGQLQVTLARMDDADETDAHCRVRYDRFSGPGPTSFETGSDCVYPFLIP
jgi:hypothetical protein